MTISAMVKMAARENKAARRTWDVGGGAHVGRKNIAERVKPYIGSGMTQTAVAKELGCSTVSVHTALKRLGETL